MLKCDVASLFDVSVLSLRSRSDRESEPYLPLFFSFPCSFSFCLFSSRKEREKEREREAPPKKIASSKKTREQLRRRIPGRAGMRKSGENRLPLYHVHRCI
ncbi:hypothetical protein KC354_g24 [Hortaea werneckii]|nr:hypothetical protein KC354_g24 [Hortaea werneckii]